jgi:hypothetical protein
MSTASIVWTMDARLVEPPAPALVDVKALAEWRQRESELLAIRKYEDDWDGFGAEAPDTKLVDTAISFLQVLRARGDNPPMRATLSPDGHVAIEWQIAGNYLRAEFLNYREAEWMRAAPGRPTEFQIEVLPIEAPAESTWERACQPNKTAVGAADSGFSSAY